MRDVEFRWTAYDIEGFSCDIDVPYPPEAWRGRARVGAGVGASLPPDRVAVLTRDLEALLRADFPGPILDEPHRVGAVLARPPAWMGERRP